MKPAQLTRVLRLNLAVAAFCTPVAWGSSLPVANSFLIGEAEYATLDISEVVGYANLPSFWIDDEPLWYEAVDFDPLDLSLAASQPDPNGWDCQCTFVDHNNDCRVDQRDLNMVLRGSNLDFDEITDVLNCIGARACFCWCFGCYE